MSGNAFKDYDISLATYSHYLNIQSILTSWFEKVKGAGSTQFYEAGYEWSISVPKNDLDFVVQASKEKIIEVIENNPYILTYKKFGNTISTLWKTENGNVHVDLMPSKNVDHESWIMTGGSKNIKGVMRNILLCYLARLKSEADSIINMKETKWTVAFPGGIGYSYNGKKITERQTDPSVILSKLCIYNVENKIERARTFEGLIQIVHWNKKTVDGFADYAKNQWLYKKQPDVIDTAIDYLISKFKNGELNDI